MKTNYILTTYFGPRANEDKRYSQNRLFFLETHLRSLEMLKHSLDQITIVVSGEDVSRELPILIKNTTVKTIRRANVGMSYGALSHAFEFYPDFDSYIFMEDDYIFTQDNFDTHLRSELEKNPKIGYLCGAEYGHAAVSVGIFRGEALRKIRDKHGVVPLGTDKDAYRAGYIGQVSQSAAVFEAGYELSDWLKTYSTVYWQSDPGIARWFNREQEDPSDPRWVRGNMTKPALVVPIQALEKRTKISDGHEWWYGDIQHNGTVEKLIKL
ncbi:MAG: hypothetical protein PHC68_04125 [Syntrophorhabdaceae bacterium]|nr:hypothetical protein [Syntrophorhabdaceae bacterium]